jgi:preprotein translocase subunit SecD
MPQYLNETLDLYLDDKLVDSLLISIDLKGKETTQVAISGSGFGSNRQEAYENALANMKKLQTILITGSLPVKLEIEKIDSVSALLGKEILRNIAITAAVLVIAVSLLIFIRYRRLSLALPVILTMLSEIVIILGVAALINWNLDLASIAGILIVIGTGVDAQIVILDEAKTGVKYSLKERIKMAFGIILGSFATTAVAMLPLWQAGAGLLKGFALTTIIGLCIGVFITRPAFGEIVSRIKMEQKS